MPGSFDEWVSSNLLWILTAVFGAGGFAWSVRALGAKIDRIHIKFDELHKRHHDNEKEIAELVTRVTVAEEKLKVLDRLVERIDDIWKMVVGLRNKEKEDK